MTSEHSLFADDQPSSPSHEEKIHFVNVAIERGMDAGWSRGDTTGLTYAARGPLPVGSAVLAPLGRGNKPVRGLVMDSGGPELLGDLSPTRVKFAEVLPTPPLPPSLVALGQWLSQYYVAPLGMVFATMVPAAVKRATGQRSLSLLHLAPNWRERQAQAKLSPSAKEVWNALADAPATLLPCTREALRDALGLPSIAPINRLVKAELLTEQQHATVRAREAVGLAQEPRVEVVPTDEQQTVIDGIAGDLAAASPNFATHLLFGVTGSGKTEVYIQLVRRALATGRNAIVLVPEIALTPQASARYTAALGDHAVTVLHSGLTGAQRHAAWQRLAAGEIRVVVGARSAVFAPLANVGLIIVDEEHDASYKQDQVPRYHGRDVAIKRGQIESAIVVLGSATPSLESYENARQRRYTLWQLRRRATGRDLPSVRGGALRRPAGRATRGEPAAPSLVGATLAARLKATLAEGGQAILLLNRRGFGRRIGCVSNACGWVQACDHCDANLVWHRSSGLTSGGTMRCHHCLAEQRLLVRCPACAGRIRALQPGTQRLEEDLATWLGLDPGSSLVRLDADVASLAGAVVDILSKFASGEAKVLLGTQMVAKGMDFPNVRLVGVLDADQSLALPDFRASERTFQLVAQVAGRAGRAQARGEVIVQTCEPRSPAIQAASKHDYPAFARHELARRFDTALPPARRMARLICRDQNHAKALERATTLAHRIRHADTTGKLEVFGPMPCVIERVADHYRFAIECLADRAATLQDVFAELRARGELKSDRLTAVDVDPVNLL